MFWPRNWHTCKGSGEEYMTIIYRFLKAGRGPCGEGYRPDFLTKKMTVKWGKKKRNV